MYILYSESLGYLEDVTEEGAVYTRVREKAYKFPLVYFMVLLFERIGRNNFPEDMEAFLFDQPTSRTLN